MLHSVVLVSATHPREAATGIDVSPALEPPSLPPHPSTLGHHSTELGSLCHMANSHQLSVLHDNVHVSGLLSRLIPASPSPAVSTSRFSRSVSLFLPCK